VDDMDQTIPLILAHVHLLTRVRDINSIIGEYQLDLSGMGVGEACIRWSMAKSPINGDGGFEESKGIIAHKLPFNPFCKHLVTYLRRRWDRQELLWSSRTGNIEWT
jgi:hypothetical protein